MDEAGFDAALLRKLLDAVGAQLEARGGSAAVVVVGGAALCLRGWVQRTTHDVDVIAVVADERGGAWCPPEFGALLAEATQRVARDFNLDAGWFNAVIGGQWETGLPDGIREDVHWVRFRGLRVGLAGRQTLITLKLIASVDQWPTSVHLQDLLALAPTDEELERSMPWVLKQDVAPGFPAAVAKVIDHVRDRR